MLKVVTPKNDNLEVCCICRAGIAVQLNGWRYGHNAAPVSDGRCCDECNSSVVIPVRMRRLGIRCEGCE